MPVGGPHTLVYPHLSPQPLIFDSERDKPDSTVSLGRCHLCVDLTLKSAGVHIGECADVHTGTLPHQGGCVELHVCTDTCRHVVGPMMYFLHCQVCLPTERDTQTGALLERLNLNVPVP